MSSKGTSEGSDDIDDDALANEWAAALEQQSVEEEQAERAALDPLTEFASPMGEGENPNLEVILDIPVMLSMEVGSTEISIRNLLQLNQGSVIELDRLAGEALDVMVNGTLVA
ncbi:MAG: FliM/FliN family flagellar motor switch protein, partial [Gammaproteobacteria bacterium]